MTMGPAPMIRTVWISVRLGITTHAKSRGALGALPGRPNCRLRGPFRWVGTVPQPLNQRVWSASPAQGPFLHRIDEFGAGLRRFRPGFLDAVVPDGGLVAVLDQHQPGVEFQALALQLHDLAVVANESAAQCPE